MAVDDSESVASDQLGFTADLPGDSVLPGEIVDAAGFLAADSSRLASIKFERETSLGNEAYFTLGSSVMQNTALRLTSGVAGEHGLAAACYRLPTGGLIPGVVNVNLSPHPVYDAQAAYAGPSRIYIALSDYAAGCWEWQGPFTDSHIILPVTDLQFTSGMGIGYVTVAVWDGSAVDVLNVEARFARDDLLAPPEIDLLEVDPVAGGNYLWWESARSKNVAGYRVYAGPAMFSEAGPGAATPISDRLLLPPQVHRPADLAREWFYCVAAVDTAGNEGPWSAVDSGQPIALEPFDFSLVVPTPSAPAGSMCGMDYAAESGVDDLVFNLDMAGDGFFEGAGMDSLPTYLFSVDGEDAARCVVQAVESAAPHRMSVMTAAMLDTGYLTVGPGMTYTTIEAALADAVSGDTILVYPLTGGAAYEQPALFVDKGQITFKGVYPPGGDRVLLDGTGYDYSGVGSIPRAIFQFQPLAHDCVVEGFELTGAHNSSYNGAGIRINQANNVTIRDCEIHDNDMGLMSNGNGTTDTAVNQVVEFCHVHHNGNEAHAGYNHNFYMGGTSVTIRACEVNNSLTGHNIKSRARFNRVEWCYVHDSANREFDFVDGVGDTDYAGADSLIVGCLIVKDPACTGNKAVISFGQDNGNGHDGTVWVVNNTIVTPFISPVVNPSAPNAGAMLYNNLVWDTDNGQTGQQLITLSGGAQAAAVGGGYCWLPYGMQIIGDTAIDTGTIYTAASGENPPFRGGSNPDIADNGWELAADDPHIVGAGLDWSSIAFPVGTGQDPNLVAYCYRDYLWLAERPQDTLATLGAFIRVN